MLTGRLTREKEPQDHPFPNVRLLLLHPPTEGQNGHADAKVMGAGKFMKHCEEVITKDAEGPMPSISGFWCGEHGSETSALAAYFMPLATVRKSSSSFQLHFQESGFRRLILPSRPGTELASGPALCSMSPAHFLLLCLPAISCPPLLSQEALKMARNLVKNQTASVIGNLSCRALSLSLPHT